MLKRLPERVDPLRLADEDARLRGAVPLAAMSRLASALTDGGSGDAQVELDFRREPTGAAVVEGRIRAELSLQCQRCLEAMPWPLAADFELAIAADEVEAERLGASYEPLLVEEKMLDLGGLVEEELLLALPLVARHAPEQCPASAHLEPQTEPEEDRRPNPFAVLSQLKHDRDD